MTRKSASALTSQRPPFSMVPVALVTAPVSDRAVRLWAVLDSHVDHRPGAEPTAWPGRQRLAQLLSCSLDSVDRTVRELEAAGWVTVQRQAGRARTNLYRLRVVQSAPVQTPPQAKAAPARPSIAAPARPKMAAPARPELEPVELEPVELENSSPSAKVRKPRAYEEQARAVAREVWEAKDPRPATPFVGVVKVAEALLGAGHSPERVSAAMEAVPTISIRWCEGWLNKHRKPGRASVEKPNRQAASGRVKL